MGLRLLYVTTRVQKVRFKRKKPRDHEKNKSKKYSVIKYKGLEEKMSLLVFFRCALRRTPLMDESS